MEHICLSFWSSQDLTSLPVLRISPLMIVYRKQSPPSIARAGARELRSTKQVQLLQTMCLELATRDSRTQESTCSAAAGSGGREPCVSGPAPSCQWQQHKLWCPEVGRACSRVLTTSLRHDLGCGPPCYVASPVPAHFKVCSSAFPESKASQDPFTKSSCSLNHTEPSLVAGNEEHWLTEGVTH